MTSFYLGLALVLAITINNRFAAVRALGVLVAAVALGFMAWSIVLADLDGTFARAPKGSILPWLLNGEAVLITLGALLLLWTIPRQFRSTTNPVLPSSTTNPVLPSSTTNAVLPLSTTNAVPPNAVPLRSTGAAYGHLTRGLHWASATLIIAAFTMGQFIAVLAADDPVRADFLTTHMAIGGAIFLLTFARMFERLVRPAPPNKAAAHVGHFLLYTLVTAVCVTGLALSPAPVDLLGLKLPNLPAGSIAGPLHRVLAALTGLLFLGHLYAAFSAIRRMAR
jgi:cytochrome b561